MGWFCWHNYVIIREPLVKRALRDNTVWNKGIKIATFYHLFDANKFAHKISDRICSKCGKLRLKLKKYTQKAVRKDERRKKAFKEGQKLLKYADKA